MKALHIINYLEEVQKSLLANLVAILLTAQSIHTTHFSALQTRSSVVQKTLEQVNTAKDQDLFIDHNVRPYTDPLDWEFEPCVGHYDTVGPLCSLLTGIQGKSYCPQQNEMSINSGPKVYLQNRLAKSRAELADLMPHMEMKGKWAFTYCPFFRPCQVTSRAGSRTTFQNCDGV